MILSSDLGFWECLTESYRRTALTCPSSFDFRSEVEENLECVVRAMIAALSRSLPDCPAEQIRFSVYTGAQ
jgi:hypothetical protein